MKKLTGTLILCALVIGTAVFSFAAPNKKAVAKTTQTRTITGTATNTTAAPGPTAMKKSKKPMKKKKKMGRKKMVQKRNKKAPIKMKM